MVDRQQKLRKLARMAFKAGNYEESVAYYQQLIAERGEDQSQVAADQQDQIELGTAFLRMSRFVEAEREFRTVVDNDPANAAAYHKLGLIDVRLGRPQQALDAFRKAAELAPKEAAYHWAYAEMALAVGAREEAEAALDASLELDPDNVDAQAAKRALHARTPDAFGGVSGRPIADSDFEGLVEFIKTRPAEDAAPVKVVDQSYRSLITVCGGAFVFLAGYLYVRLVLIG